MPERTDDMIWWDEDFFIETGKHVPGSEPKSSLVSGAFTTYLQPGLRQDMSALFNQQSMQSQMTGAFGLYNQQLQQAQFSQPRPLGGLASLLGGLGL